MRNDVSVDLYLGGQLGWVDVSGDVRQAMADSGGGITITRTDRDAGTMDLVLANPGGKYSPRNPRSPYYGLLGRNTPIRCGVEMQRFDFGETLAATWGPGWTYVQAGDVFTPAQHGVDGGQAWHQVTNAGGYRLTYWTGRPVVDCEVRTTVSITGVSDVTGAALEPANIVFRVQDINTYYLARVEITAGEQVLVSLRHTSGGVVAGPVTVPGLTYSGQTLAVAASCVGDRLAVKVWPAGGAEPMDWQVTGTDSRITAAGYVGIRTGAAGGNTNVPLTARYDYMRVIDRRAHMEVAEWPPRWTIGGHDVWVPVRAEGLIRRLRQGAKPLASALTRHIPSTNPIGWWPLEDGQEATRAASGLLGRAPLLGDGLETGLGGEGPPGAASGMTLGDGVLSGPVPSGVTSNSWTVSVWIRASVDDITKVAGVMPVGWTSRAGAERWRVLVQSGLEDAISGVVDPNVHRITVTQVTDAASGGFAPFTVRVTDGQWHLLSVALQQQGADIAAWVVLDGVDVASGWMTGATLSAPETLRVPGDVPPFNLSACAVGHVQIHNGPSQPDEVWAGRGYAGETAAARIRRLCAEQRVSVLVTDGPDLAAAMGPQRPITFLDLLAECADADMGILGEAREQLALTYRCRSALYNQVALSLPYTMLAPSLEPVDDDALVRNDVTVSRAGGSSARAVVDVGPLSVQPPPAGVGTYDTQVTLTLASDGQLVDAAGWLVHLGTWDEARYPVARVELAAPEWAGVPDLAAAVTALEAGWVLALTELPEWLPPGPSAQMVRGSVEQIHQPTRMLEWALRPAGPWTVAEADGEPRAPLDDSQLAGTLTEAGMSMMVITPPESGLWTVDPMDWPLAMRVGGERVTVSAVAGAAVDNFGRTVGSGWGTADSGQVWTTSAGTSVSGGAGRHSLTSVNSFFTSMADIGAASFELSVDISLSIGAGASSPVTIWVCGRLTDLSNYYVARMIVGTSPGTVAVQLFKRVGGVLTDVSSAVTAGVNAANDAWRLTFVRRAANLSATLQNLTAGTPPVSVSAIDTALVTGTGIGLLSRLEAGNTNTLPVTISYDNLVVPNPQRLTMSARGVNGVQRQWLTGTPVDVWVPAVAPL